MSEKQKFIVALNDIELTKKIVSLIDQQVDRAQTVLAEDGKQLQSKIENDPPQVVVMCRDLAKISGEDVVRSLQPRLLKEIAFVFADEIPDLLEFADRVASGQFQYIAPKDVPNNFEAALSRALAWLKRGDTVDFTIKRVSAGEFLMRQGDKAESVYILKKGHMKAYLKSSAEPVSHGFLLGEIEAKEFVGEMAYINGEVRSADVIADTDCELIEIPISHLDRLLFQKPAWAMALMKTLSKRMKTANQQRADD
jgi:CRP/FNR family cyclic AMP-dependent transcriptional regulator